MRGKMKIDCEGKNKLYFFQALYDEARASIEDEYEKMKRHAEQYRGSAQIDGSAVKASVVRNITYELIESQVTSYIPTPKVTPKMQSDRNERNAKSIETLLKNKRDELPFERMNDLDERYNPIYGGSVWHVEWDNGITTHDTVGDVRVTCLSPMHFVGQPGIYELADMEYCFITFETTKEDIARKYGIRPELAEQAVSTENGDDKTATLIVCYYRNEDGKVCEYVWSSDTQLLDIEDYYARKRYVCRKCGKRKEICNCEHGEYTLQNEEYEELDRDIPLSDGSVLPAMSEVIRNGQVVTETIREQGLQADGSPALTDIGGVLLPAMVEVTVPKTERTRIPFYHPDCFPLVIRKNTSAEDSVFGQSDCEFVRPQQQAINKVESRIMEKVISGGVFPIVPRDWNGELDNSIFKKVFRADPGNVNLFGRIDLQVDISRDASEAERLYDHAKRVLGISDSYQGQYDSSAQSGKAKQLQIQQAAGRLDSKRQMKNAAYSDIDRIIFQYYLAYADEPRPATFIDAQGRRQNVMFNRYDFVERDSAGEYFYNDQYLFSTDATIDVDRSRESLWEMNLQNLQLGAYGDPSLPETKLIYWQNMERAHYPWAADNVERIKAEIERQREADMQMQQMQEMQGQIESLQSEVRHRAGYEDYLNKEIQKMTGGQAS